LTEESRSTLSAAAPNALERRSYEVVLERNASTLLLVTETRFAPQGSQEELTLRVVRDLTDRVVTERRQRDLERELQHSQALQSLAAMAGGVAHDLTVSSSRSPPADAGERSARGNVTRTGQSDSMARARWAATRCPTVA
jgi:hypothetical protein